MIFSWSSQGARLAVAALLLAGCSRHGYDHPPDAALDGGTADQRAVDSAAAGDGPFADGPSTREDGRPDAPAANVFQSLPLPPGGEITALSLSPLQQATLYTITNNQRLFASTNGGSTWSECPLPAPQPTCVAASSTAASVVYLCAGQDLYASADACASWQPLGASVPPLTVLPLSDGVLLAGTTRGLWRHEGSWTAIPSPHDGLEVTSLAVSADEQLLFAGSATNGVIRSEDGGDSWTLANGAADAALGRLEVRQVLLQPGSSDLLFAATTDGLYRSADRGQHWLEILSDVGIYSMACDPAQPENMIVSTSWKGLRASSDAGQTFPGIDRRGGDMQVDRIGLLAFDPHSPGRIIAGATGGIYVAQWGGWHWVRFSTGLAALRLTDIATLQDTLVLSSSAGLRYSHDQGQSWQQADAPYTSYSLVKTLGLTPAGSLLAAGKDLLESSNGSSYALLHGGTWGWSFLSLAADEQTIYIGSSTRFGRWDISGGTMSNSLIQGAERALEALLLDPAFGLLAGTSVSPLASGGIFLSPDGGESFVVKSDGLPGQINVYALARLSSGQVAAGTDQGIYLADPATWQWTGAGGPAPANTLLVAGGKLLAGGRGVFWRSESGGGWVVLPGLDQAQVTGMIVDAQGRLLVTTEGSGLFATPAP